jgi:hypothetical protein
MVLCELLAPYPARSTIKFDIVPEGETGGERIGYGDCF